MESKRVNPPAAGTKQVSGLSLSSRRACEAEGSLLVRTKGYLISGFSPRIDDTDPHLAA